MQFFDQFIRALMPIHNRFVATPGARMGDREAALVTEILKRLGMESDYLTRDAPDVSAGGKWSNFFETLQKRMLDRIPPAFRPGPVSLEKQHPAAAGSAATIPQDRRSHPYPMHAVQHPVPRGPSAPSAA